MYDLMTEGTATAVGSWPAANDGVASATGTATAPPMAAHHAYPGSTPEGAATAAGVLGMGELDPRAPAA
jgi:hypothetical protein